VNNTKIEWADHTINYCWGCTKVSEGCKFCYAEAVDARFHADPHWGPGSTRKLQIDTARRQLAKVKAGQRVFVNSMSDTFEWHPDLDEARLALFDDIARRSDVVFMLLTKRPENVMKLVPPWWGSGFPPNVWMGTTVENQQRANERIPELLEIPAAVRFLSCEPLLGPISINYQLGVTAYPPHSSPLKLVELLPSIHWVIVGGESGREARPMHPDWARRLRDQCAAAGVPFFFKQWGEFGPVQQHKVDLEEYRGKGRMYDNDQPFVDDHGWAMLRLGKHNAGRLLDGVEHNGLPTV
jgi:protein gp37